MKCTFFGHRNTPSWVAPILKKVIVELIQNGVKEFYVGNHGNFDNMAIKILNDLTDCYPEIKYSKVLAYIPIKKDKDFNSSNTIYPEGLENVPPKFAIIGRNRWMIEKSDYVICYVENTLSNAYEFMTLAIRKERKVINLKEYTE